jgi:hypothetical protein
MYGSGGLSLLTVRKLSRMKEYVRRSTYFPFRRFLGDVRLEFMQRLSRVLYGTIGSYLRDFLQEGGAFVVACLPTPRPCLCASLVDSNTFFL